MKAARGRLRGADRRQRPAPWARRWRTKASPSRRKDFGFTSSHQIAVNVAAHGGGVPVAQRLEANDIIVNYNLLPFDTDARKPSGLRIGVQEMTRYGMKERQMRQLAELMAGAIKGSDVKQAVHDLRGFFQEVGYV